MSVRFPILFLDEKGADVARLQIPARDADLTRDELFVALVEEIDTHEQAAYAAGLPTLPDFHTVKLSAYGHDLSVCGSAFTMLFFTRGLFNQGSSPHSMLEMAQDHIDGLKDIDLGQRTPEQGKEITDGIAVTYYAIHVLRKEVEREQEEA